VELNCSFTAARMRLAANEKVEAEKIVQIKKAEGEAESKYLAGVGIARHCQANVDGLRDVGAEPHSAVDPERCREKEDEQCAHEVLG
jgi:hypothetical protein